MHTQRLKAIQIPSGTLSLLESFATSIMRPATGARVIRTLKELPPRHRERVGRGTEQHYLWYAWEDAGRVRLVTGAMSLERSRERGRPVLEARIYDDQGLLEESGAWLRTPEGRWERCDW
ncbi:MAG TPA: hypothetical protein VFI92_01195 [Steroidobacteraceae bacterium]|nr:hypothetical protein [Steroidobacteraceae bacterium]